MTITAIRRGMTQRISRITLLFISFLLLAVAAYPALAQDATSSTATRREKVQQRIEIRGADRARKENVQDRVTVMREKAASKEAALKARLETCKDKRKAQTAERVNTNLNKINQNQTSQMLKHLNRMSEILDKLEARVKQATLAKTAIADARAAIASSSAAVSAQAEKDYTVQVTSETKIRQDVQAQREQLHTDLKAVRQLVIDAKQKAANAIRVAKKEGTTSGQQ